ncbi:Smr/MutS family protein [Salidesulfovibrio brasiliensis]|uniref:Smr/MutS family protein n=1 Tax=Salidesulfovibrio brasiliensis TaxID=221711 RepID=UPI0006CFC088|nr:Smr/MutS family protein [Salidesulfovibrio brasiliensis]
MGKKKKKLGSLDDLSKLRLEPEKPKDYASQLLEKAKKKRQSEYAEETEIVEEAQEPDEADLFFNAMQGVDQLSGSGREVAASKPKVKKSALKKDAEKKALDDFLSGNIEFELEHTEEYMHGYVRGLDSKIFQQLKAGTLSREAHVDMHGLNSDQAFDTLLFFIRESYLQNKRCLLVVTGRGRNSPGGRSVLKQEIQTWLTREPLRRIVLAFCTALPKDGGGGALYVLLRKQKKQQGKVKWDKQMNWES